MASWTTWTGRPAGPTARNARSAMPWCTSWMRVVLPRSVSRASFEVSRISSARIAVPLVTVPDPEPPCPPRARQSGTASGGAGGLPEVDPAVDGVLVDGPQLVVVEREVVQRRDVLLQLVHAARPDQHGGHARVAQRPGEGHLREALAPGL